MGSFQKKILLLLAAGVSLGLSYTPKRRYRVFRELGKEWEKINTNTLRRAIESIYKNKLIDYKENVDGSLKMILLEKGRQKTLEYKLEEIEIKKPEYWDKKWHIILFDIPTDKVKLGNSLRYHLKRLGFYQYQKSVFIYPYKCDDEIDFLIEFHKLRPYVRKITAIDLDNDLHLRKIFKDRNLL